MSERPVAGSPSAGADLRSRRWLAAKAARGPPRLRENDRAASVLPCGVPNYARGAPAARGQGRSAFIGRSRLPCLRTSRLYGCSGTKSELSSVRRLFAIAIAFFMGVVFSP